ncbi:hypothetical protein POI8812_00200 [Pontivivens insulae]|uniref:Uncharacterized protein n=1 Tax=Pontivivens insulae TaxID=1639689 RepID=A0A2R8A6S3_9RHOB|nr:hypothetical protein DFR53_0201 [Pontivivens insulae]SPF27905.1 hypothetical protein POI8812_00200 [Pontivivens insulae]
MLQFCGHMYRLLSLLSPKLESVDQISFQLCATGDLQLGVSTTQLLSDRNRSPRQRYKSDALIYG